MQKIERFIHPDNSSLTTEENLQIKNRSNHDNQVHQAIFCSIDEFAKRVVKDVHNLHSKKLFESNRLNIVSDEQTITKLIEDQFGGKLNNPEMIYRAFNFIKPPNLLPRYNNKLYLIKQVGINESGIEQNYVINPFFFGFKVCFDIFMTALHCFQFDETLENGLVRILTDKYGEEYKDIYEYVAYISYTAAKEGAKKGDQEDETFISEAQKISGINDYTIFHNFIYHSASITANSKAEILAANNGQT